MDDNPMVLTSRTNKDPNVRDVKLTRLEEEHVRDLTRYVEALRAAVGDPEGVPYFDPDDGGVRARVLLLLEAPGPKSALASGKAGSGIISSDNDDPTAHNVFTIRDEVGLPRRYLVAWNVVPWYREGAPPTEEIYRGAAHLPALLALLPDVRVVVAMGAAAQKGIKWLRKHPPGLRLPPVISCPHPSARNFNVHRKEGYREMVVQAFRDAKALADVASS